MHGQIQKAIEFTRKFDGFKELLRVELAKHGFEFCFCEAARSGDQKLDEHIRIVTVRRPDGAYDTVTVRFIARGRDMYGEHVAWECAQTIASMHKASA